MTLPNEFLEKRLLLRPAEAADALGIGRSKIYHLFAIGEVPSIRIGGSVRVPVDELRDWVSARQENGNEGAA